MTRRNVLGQRFTSSPEPEDPEEVPQEEPPIDLMAKYNLSTVYDFTSPKPPVQLRQSTSDSLSSWEMDPEDLYNSIFDREDDDVTPVQRERERGRPQNVEQVRGRPRRHTRSYQDPTHHFEFSPIRIRAPRAVSANASVPPAFVTDPDPKEEKTKA